MARAQYVYVVQQVGCITPLAAFTVKHEMETWLHEHATNDDIIIWRVRHVDQTISRIV